MEILVHLPFLIEKMTDKHIRSYVFVTNEKVLDSFISLMSTCHSMIGNAKMQN